jgi:hypothetical protein
MDSWDGELAWGTMLTGRALLVFRAGWRWPAWSAASCS